VLVIVFDTLSALHLSLYGYARRTTPNLERIAARGIVYHRHYAGGNFTSPGTASLLTGNLPFEHRCYHLNGQVLEAFERQNIFHAFAAAGYTNLAYTQNLLANLLLHQFQHGIARLTDSAELYLTHSLFYPNFPGDTGAAYRADFSLFRNPNLPTVSPFASLLYRLWRFRSPAVPADYAQMFPRGLPTNPDALYPSGHLFLLEDALDWLVEQLAALPQPFLAYHHLLPPHDPYNTRRDFVDLFQDGWQPPRKPEHPFTWGFAQETLDDWRRAYDEYIAYVDAEFGRLYDTLRASGALDNTILVFTSDHGQLFERGIHGHVNATMYEPLIRIPLLILLPGHAARTDIHDPTSCTDILPTLLHLAGQPLPDWCLGSLLPPFGAASPRRIFTLEAKENPKLGPIRKATASVIAYPYKLIHYRGHQALPDNYELYDLANDPEELADLYPSQPATAAELKRALLARLDGVR
jgi:arylsulfatase A-like enzyme